MKYCFRLCWSSALGKFFRASLFTLTAYDLIFYRFITFNFLYLKIDTTTNTVDYMRTYHCYTPLNKNPSKVTVNPIPQYRKKNWQIPK